jgi:chromate transporter
MDTPRVTQSGPVPLREATRVWLHVGLNSFGGPAGQLAVMHTELVERRRWLSERRFLHALNYAMVLPGPEAQQAATYLGLLVSGIRGALVAGGLFILPGFVVMMLLSAVYATAGDVPLVAGVMRGLQSAVIAIVLQAVLRLGQRTLRTPLLVGVAGAAFVALFAFDTSFPVVVVGAALLGWLVGRARPGLLPDDGQAEDPDAGADSPDYLLADHEELSPRQSRDARRAALACLVVWLAPIAALLLTLGRDNIFTQQALLFARTALVAFGGAYAVLAYVAEVAVVDKGWLSADDMTAGLGLAETTPGPLILVLQFVGFLAAYNDPGTLPPLLAGFFGACVTVWATFVPCFMFIYAGAPYVERLRGSRPLHHALTAVGSAIVGVILNLALWFALNTLFRQVATVSWGPVTLPVPQLASIDAVALALTAVALVLVFGRGMPTPKVLLVCASLGLLVTVVGV